MNALAVDTAEMNVAEMNVAMDATAMNITMIGAPVDPVAAAPATPVASPAASRATGPALHLDFRPLAIPALVAATRVMTGGSKTKPIGG